MELIMKLIQQPIEFIWLYAVPFVGVLSILVFVHEWGHYIVAKLSGVRIESFSIGFGRELWGWTDKSGTRWKISLVPLGGYVAMFGDRDPASAQSSSEIEDGDVTREMTKDELNVAFFSQPLGTRALIVVAGPVINFLFAIVLLAGLYIVVGQPYLPPVAASLVEGGAADRAGLEPGDLILSINEQRIERFEDIKHEVLVNLGSPMELKINRKDQETGKERQLDIKILPDVIHETDRFGFKHSTGRLGIISPPVESAMKKHTLVSGFIAATLETGKITASTFEAIWQMISGTRSTEELGGIIRIGAYAGEFAQNGLVSLITFAALLSVNLGLLNLFPIPLLDGGHLAFYAVEAIKGGPMGEKTQEYSLRFGLALILCIMVYATWNDLVQLQVIDYVKNLVS